MVISLVNGKDGLEGERKLHRAMSVEMCDAAFCFDDARNMAGRHPPQGSVSALEPLEPGVPHAKQLAMRAVIDILPQSFNALPYRHVEQQAFVFEWPQVRGVPLIRLQTPHESGACIGENVDLFEALNESSHDRIVELSTDPADVYLGEMIAAHGWPPPVKR